MMVPQLAEVRRGAALLDKMQPGWAKQINTTTLEMGSSCDCILGQLYGDYIDGAKAIGLCSIYQRIHYGFSTCGKWSDLDRLWKSEVTTMVGIKDVG